VELDEETLEMKEGDEVTLTATIIPGNATTKTITWSSSDETVATVEGTGPEVTVKALKVGTATITAAAADGQSADCEVTVERITKSSGIPITFDQIENAMKLDISVESVTLSLSGTVHPTSKTITLLDASTYSTKRYTVKGKTTAIGNDGIIELKANELDLGTGTFFLALVVEKDNVWYNTTLELVLVD
jgi:hypothetical protein